MDMLLGIAGGIAEGTGGGWFGRDLAQKELVCSMGVRGVQLPRRLW